MKEYQQKYKLERMIYSKTTAVILFILCLLLFRSVMELNNKRIEVDSLRDETRKDKEDLESRLTKTQERNDFIKTERGMEGYIRNTYPVVKEGEGVIVIYENEKNPVSVVREDMTIWERVIVMWRRLIKE